MVGTVKLVGIFMVAMGAIYLVKPAMMKKYLRFWMKKNRIYWGGALSIVIAIMFFLAASRCTMSWFVILVGILSLLKGTLIFIAGPTKFSTFSENILKSSAKNLRAMALFALVLGILLIYSV